MKVLSKKLLKRYLKKTKQKTAVVVLVVHEQGSDGLEIPSEEGNVKEEKELSLGERRI